MTSRISQTFQTVKEKNQKALITYIMGYDPNLESSTTLLTSLSKAGADIIELGIPFSDPMADGPTIQKAAIRALKAGATVKKILTIVSEFRKHNDTTPIILMGYYNPIYHYGAEKFAADAAQAGIDGIILVDLPPEEESELTPHLENNHIAFVRLIAPTTDTSRRKAILKSAKGFLYYIAVTGITGGKSANYETLKKEIETLKEETDLPIAVGFGIKTPEDAKKVAAFADAVVVGSALIDIYEKEGQKPALDFVTFLKSAL